MDPSYCWEQLRHPECKEYFRGELAARDALIERLRDVLSRAVPFLHTLPVAPSLVLLDASALLAED